jgi:ATP-dependent DNA helicase RecG
MNRLLHGDVGSGKTVVALSAMLHAVDAGYQAALMAPTQILAEQHFLNFHNLLAPLGVAVALRTGARDENPGSKAVGQPDLFDDGKQRLPQIVVGTHALLFEEGLFDRLGLVVIDEQHKFGVLQRASLRRQGPSADVLVMTATPIPRTLTMTLYGDLDVSVLDELPKGRQKVVTVARPRTKLPEATKFIREHLDKGRQAYIVYPLIEGSERSEAKAAKEEHGRWTEALHPHRCALIHGRIRPEEKEQIMTDFRDAKVKVLVATSVIEVGIDVPNANIILIENAERFGLAQLHQLRGRVGRGAHKSYCVLLTESGDADDLEKLRVLERTANGFEIAEADLELRGPGDLLGTAQSGASPLRLGNPVRDLALMQEARDAAFALLERDPDCQLPENSRFAQFLQTAVPTETPSLDLSQVS